MSLLTHWRKQPNPNWYADGEPGTREQWRQRAYEAEDNADRYRRALVTRSVPCSCPYPNPSFEDRHRSCPIHGDVSRWRTVIPFYLTVKECGRVALAKLGHDPYGMTLRELPWREVIRRTWQAHNDRRWR